MNEVVMMMVMMLMAAIYGVLCVRHKAECFMLYHLILTTIMLKSIDLHFTQDKTEVHRS